MNAINPVFILHTRALVSEETKDMLRAIARAGLAISTEITQDELVALYEEALVLGVKYDFPVWISKKGGKGSLNIIETPVASEPVSEPVSDGSDVFDLFVEDEEGKDDTNPPVSEIPSPVPTVAPAPTPAPVPEAPVAPAPVAPAPSCPVVSAAPAPAPIPTAPTEVEINIELLTKLTWKIIQANARDFRQNPKNYISTHLLESKVAKEVLGYSLRYNKNKNESRVVLRPEEHVVVNKVVNELVKFAGLKLSVKGTGYVIPMQTMVAHGKDFYTKFKYEEQARRMHGRGKAQFYYIINLADEKIIAHKISDDSVVGVRELTKGIAHINATCNLVECVASEKPSDVGTPSVGGDWYDD